MDSKEIKSPTMDSKEIKSSITLSRCFIATLFITVFASYTIWFFFMNNSPTSTLSSDWGSFGDFIGGILNPIVACFAFYWLTKSVQIQQHELSETKKALIESSDAQNKLVKLTNKNITLTLTRDHLKEVTTILNMTIEKKIRVVDQMKAGDPATKEIIDSEGNQRMAKIVINEINKEIDAISNKKNEILKALRLISAE